LCLFPNLPPRISAAQTTSSQATLEERAGAWWISTPTGLLRFPAANRNPDLWLLRDLECRRLLEDQAGNIWVETKHGKVSGLAKWAAGQRRIIDISARLPERAGSDSISALAASGGSLWLGLGRPGRLFRLRDETVEEIPGIPPGTVNALHCDRRGHIWVATSDAGLAEVDMSGARPFVPLYDARNRLSSNEVWCLTEDRLGRIYAGTSRGVDRLDPATGRITHYSHTDGLTSGDIRAAMRDRRGDLWFLSNRGLSRLHPVQEPTQRPVEARITGMRVAGAPQPISEIGEMNVAPAGFEWSRNSVEIQFSAVDFQSPETLRYQFRLEGAAGEWSEPTPERTVRFANLAPGHYRFLVRALQPDGTASPKLASFAFTIRPAPWRQWWFETIAVGILLGLAYTWHRSRLNRQLALERVRSRIATDLHDDIGASLARIAVMSEAMKERVSAADGDSQRMLGQIAEASRTVVEGMSNIVWSIDPRRDNVADVVARLRAFGSDVLEPAGIRWICEDASGGPKKELSPDQRRQMYLIFKEAIHNVARHSGARNVTLRIHVQDNYVYGEIQDDGRGVTSDAGPGLGIGSMTARAGRLGGEFRVSAGPEGGRRATVRFRLW